MTAGSFLLSVAVGYAQLLDSLAVGLAWREDGTYPGGTVGMWVGGLPDTPDTAVALTPYGLADDAAMSDSTVGLQIVTRGPRNDRTTPMHWDEAIFDQLAGLWPVTLPNGVAVSVQTRTSSGPLGQDDSGRWRRTSNYTNQLYRPSTHRH